MLFWFRHFKGFAVPNFELLFAFNSSLLYSEAVRGSTIRYDLFLIPET
jgi:hypothetical protein